MAEVFGRKYSLTIGRNTHVISKVLPAPPPSYFERQGLTDSKGKIDWTNPSGFFLAEGGYVDLTTIPAQSLVFTEHQMKAVIDDNKNTNKGSGNSSKFELYNPTSDEINFIKAGNSIILKAGWEQDEELPLLHVGQIQEVTVVRNPPDIIVQITSSPMELIKDVKVAKSYPPLTTLRSIILDLVGLMASAGIPTGKVYDDELSLAVFEKQYWSGYVVQGDLFDELKTICNDNGLRAYIVLGRLYVEPKGFTELREIALIEEDTVKGYLSKDEDNSGQESTQNGTTSGFKGSLLLNGNIKTSTLARVLFGEFEGDYTIPSVRHVLDYEGPKWDTEVEGVKAQ